MAGTNHKARRRLLQPAKAQDAVMFIFRKARGNRRADTVARHVGDDCLACKGNGRRREDFGAVGLLIDGERSKATSNDESHGNRGRFTKLAKRTRPIQQKVAQRVAVPCVEFKVLRKSWNHFTEV